MNRTARLIGSLCVALLFGLAAFRAPPIQAQTKICFGEVPDCIEGRFAEFWQQNGGLPVFGFPIGPARLERIGGGEFLVQPFERNRFELHPENARPYDVLLGRLGDDRLRQTGRPWEAEPKAPATSQPGCQYFPETGHLVCEPFLGYWRTHGLSLDGRAGFTAAESLALFGLPLTEARPETGSDGNQYLTQWFERARFELHPEIGPNAVLLGLLGREVLAPQPPAPQPPPPAPPASDVPASVNATVSPTSGPPGTRFVARGFGFKPGEKVGVYTTAPDQSVFGAPFQVDVDRNGGTDEVTLTMGVDAPQGLFTMTFEGISSKHKAFAYFRVTAPAPPTGDTSVPASQNAVVDPPAGPGGTEFLAIGLGFKPGERVGVYVTAPDQRVYGAPFQVGANDDGSTEPVWFETTSSSQRGVWAMTFEGISSGHKAIAYFRVLP
jgi:hypothetical protein